MSANNAGGGAARTPAPDAASSGNAEGNNANNNNNNNNRRGRYNNPRGGRNARRYQQRFEGSEPLLREHVYDYTTGNNAEQYIKTTKNITDFVGSKYHDGYAEDFRVAVETLQLPVLIKPIQPTDPTDLGEFEIYKLEVRNWYDRNKAHGNFKVWLYSVVMGQCTPSLEAVIRAHTDYAAAQNDGLALLRIIRSLTHTYEPDNEHMALALYRLKKKFFAF